MVSGVATGVMRRSCRLAVYITPQPETTSLNEARQGAVVAAAILGPVGVGYITFPFSGNMGSWEVMGGFYLDSVHKAAPEHFRSNFNNLSVAKSAWRRLVDQEKYVRTFKHPENSVKRRQLWIPQSEFLSSLQKLLVEQVEAGIKAPGRLDELVSKVVPLEESSYKYKPISANIRHLPASMALTPQRTLLFYIDRKK